MTAADLIGIAFVALFVGLPGLIIMYAIAAAGCDIIREEGNKK